MQHVETTISDTAIRVRYADASDPAKASEWLDVQVARADLKLSGQPIAEMESRFLSELQAAAIDHARQLIEREIRRLKNAGR